MAKLARHPLRLSSGTATCFRVRSASGWIAFYSCTLATYIVTIESSQGAVLKPQNDLQKEPVQMADIARMAGVSKSTVSRALSDSPLVNEATKSLVRDIAHAHNYRVNVAARNFRLKESLPVSLLIPEAEGVEWSISDPFFLEITAAIAEALDERGHTLLLSRTTPQSGQWIEDFVNRRHADGVILIGQGSQHDTLQRIASHYRGISIWGESVAGALYPTVGSDNELGGRRAVERLLLRGCKRIAFVGLEPVPEVNARYAGYRAALQIAGLTCDEALTFGVTVGSESAVHVLEELLLKRDCFDAIFAASDLQAVAVMTALMQVGVSVPNDCAVIGYDDVPLAAWYHPALTTIRQNRTLGAQILVDNLLAGIEGRETANVKLDPELIVRDSA